jgi:glycosyltransferase involved in cell wall biosynthesis
MGHAATLRARDGDSRAPHLLRLEDASGLLHREGIDVVYVHGYFRRFEQQLLATCSKIGVPLVMRGEFDRRSVVSDSGVVGGRLKAMLKRYVLRRRLRHVDAFGVIGNNAAACLDELGIPASRRVFAPYAVDDESLLRDLARADRGVRRRSLGVPEDAIVLMFSGKLIDRKQPLHVVNAIARCRHRSRYFLLVVGDGPQRHELERAGKASGVAFACAGFVNQSRLADYFAAADVFVLPSTFETWGLVVNEAMWCGLPCICSDAVG